MQKPHGLGTQREKSDDFGAVIQKTNPPKSATSIVACAENGHFREAYSYKKWPDRPQNSNA